MIIINKSEIILAVKNYIKDEKAKYAILINGPWGCGKTFLYEKYLIGEINKISNPNNKKRRKNIYISLYGISSIETLSKQVMADYLFYSKNNKGKEVVKKTAGLLGILSNVFSISIGPVKADLSKAFSKVTNLTKIKNLVVCFDDLERCTIPINELFGFVNNLIEHCDCKVIILADEKNIGKIFVNTNVEQKYQTILTGERKVILDNKEGLKKENINENSDITIDELKEITEHLYSENYIYKDIKEKIVGKTYNYCESNEEIINDLLIGNDRYKGYVENEIYNNFLIKQIENIISGFNEVNNRNIRNIIVWIDIFKNIFLACDKNLKNNDFFNDIIEEFIRYSIWVVVSYRNNIKILSSTYYGDYDYVHLEKKEHIHIIKFSYIDKYVKSGFFKEKDLIDAAKSIEMRKERERLYEKEIVQSTGVAFMELTDWKYMEDEDIKYHVINMLEELKDNKYSYRDYSKILDLLVFFKKIKLYSGDIIEV